MYFKLPLRLRVELCKCTIVKRVKQSRKVEFCMYIQEVKLGLTDGVRMKDFTGKMVIFAFPKPEHRPDFQQTHMILTGSVALEECMKNLAIEVLMRESAWLGLMPGV